jgi:hypothetical protein
MEEQLEQLRREAREYCHFVNLDGAIRTLCKGSESQGSNINRSVKLHLPNGKILDLRATWGAGCNGAYARYADSTLSEFFHLYNCTEYGSHLSAFQMGDWVDIVLSLADQELLAQQAQSQASRMRRLQEELLKWMPAE